LKNDLVKSTTPFGPARDGTVAVPSRLIAWVLTVATALLLGASARAEVHGGIEIGAKGIKATVLEIITDPKGYEVSIKLADTTNTTLVAGLARTGSFDPKAVVETATVVGQYFTKMKADFQIDPKHIYIVGSSGLFIPFQDKPDQVRTNQRTLADAVRSACGASMIFIDAKREVELSIARVLPCRFRDEAVLIDVGSRNTKGGYISAQSEIISVVVPYGTVSFTEVVKKAGGSFADKARKLRDEELAPTLKKELISKPEMTARTRVFLSGGIVWAAATLTNPCETAAFTPLTVNDLTDLQRRLEADPGKYPSPDVSAIADESKRKQALAEIHKVQKVFSPEQLLAGTHILKALAYEMQLVRGKSQVYFDGAWVGQRADAEGLEFGQDGRGPDEAIAGRRRGVGLKSAAD
jgi:hypothetical protein